MSLLCKLMGRDPSFLQCLLMHAGHPGQEGLLGGPATSSSGRPQHQHLHAGQFLTPADGLSTSCPLQAASVVVPSQAATRHAADACAEQLASTSLRPAPLLVADTPSGAAGAGTTSYAESSSDAADELHDALHRLNITPRSWDPRRTSNTPLETPAETPAPTPRPCDTLERAHSRGGTSGACLPDCGKSLGNAVMPLLEKGCISADVHC